MTFYMIAGIVSVIVSVVLIFIYLISHKMDDHSLAAKIVCWVGMLFGVAGAVLMTIEYSFPHVSHPEKYEEKEMIAYVNTCAATQFSVDYGEDTELITINTIKVDNYYITSIHYRIVFDNKIYMVEYISSVNDNNELIMRKVEAQ